MLRIILKLVYINYIATVNLQQHLLVSDAILMEM